MGRPPYGLSKHILVPTLVAIFHVSQVAKQPPESGSSYVPSFEQAEQDPVITEGFALCLEEFQSTVLLTCAPVYLGLSTHYLDTQSSNRFPYLTTTWGWLVSVQV